MTERRYGAPASAGVESTDTFTYDRAPRLDNPRSTDKTKDSNTRVKGLEFTYD